MLCNYTGTDSRYYLDYRDAGTGRVLEASPGGTYNVEVVSGQAAGLPLPPGDGRWTAVFAVGGVIETPAPDAPSIEGVLEATALVQQVKAPVLADLPPVLAAMAVAQVTPEEAGDSPAEVES